NSVASPPPSSPPPRPPWPCSSWSWRSVDPSRLAPRHRRRGEEDILDAGLDCLDVARTKRAQAIEQCLDQVLWRRRAGTDAHPLSTVEPGWIELCRGPEQVAARAGRLGH